MRAIPDLIQDYARAFYEYHLRTGGYRSFGHRLKFDIMTDEQVSDELHRLKVAMIDRYSTTEPERPDTT